MMLLAAALATAALLPGTYTNEEQVYFAAEAGKPVPPWTGMRITAAGDAFRVQPVDAFGASTGAETLWRVKDGDKIVSITSSDCVRDFARVPAGLTIVNHTGGCRAPGLTTLTEAGIALRAGDGTVLEMQRGRAFKCWISIPRRVPKADGTQDWWFKSGLMLHDAGGRVTATTDEAVPQSYTLRMRNVAWPSGNNAPSLVLYVHANDPAYANGYSWTDPAAKLVGINLRSVQGSCTLVEPKS